MEEGGGGGSKHTILRTEPNTIGLKVISRNLLLELIQYDIKCRNKIFGSLLSILYMVTFLRTKLLFVSYYFRVID